MEPFLGSSESSTLGNLSPEFFHKKIENQPLNFFGYLFEPKHNETIVCGTKPKMNDH
jgi:hypothetical protein